MKNIDEKSYKGEFDTIEPSVSSVQLRVVSGMEEFRKTSALLESRIEEKDYQGVGEKPNKRSKDERAQKKAIEKNVDPQLAAAMWKRLDGEGLE